MEVFYPRDYSSDSITAGQIGNTPPDLGVDTGSGLQVTPGPAVAQPSECADQAQIQPAAEVDLSPGYAYLAERLAETRAAAAAAGITADAARIAEIRLAAGTDHIIQRAYMVGSLRSALDIVVEAYASGDPEKLRRAVEGAFTVAEASR